MKFTKRAMVHSKETRESQKEFWNELCGYGVVMGKLKTSVCIYVEVRAPSWMISNEMHLVTIRREKEFVHRSE